MALSKEENLVYGIKISSIGPGRATETDVVHELSSIDLAMKLHYHKVVYLFSSQAAQGLTIVRMKETMFDWLNEYYYTSGRLRRLESGRPYIKCNDCGARFIEAECDKTIHEFLDMDMDCSLQNLLVSQQVIGPELSFSPPVYIQVTRFKCGGISLGLNWAHVLGDAFSAAKFMNRWGQIVSGLQPNNKAPNIPKSDTQIERSKKEPLSMKRVDPVGDHWITSNNCKMVTFSFHITATQLANLRAEISGHNQFPIFESICAIIWHCVVKVREWTQPKVVTICKSDPRKPTNGILGNTQIIGTVEADFSIIETSPKKLATLLVNQVVDERSQIEELVESDGGVSDFIVYGAKLTFVDLEEANCYGLELNGHKPDFVYHTIQGVGDEGAVLVIPGPKESCKDSDKERIVTIIFPENQVAELKSELVKNGLLLDDNLA